MEPMVIGVRFDEDSKLYYYTAGDVPLEKGDHVIVEGAQGRDYGTVEMTDRRITDPAMLEMFRPIIRKASVRDDEQYEKNKERAKEAYRIGIEKIKAHNLDMKVTFVKVAFDNSKITFFFTADDRVDFRELVKDLAGALRARIDLRQIGARDETKMHGGIGPCGRELCCHLYLKEFSSVSIKMVKNQGLAMSGEKFTGICGRLMCCLSYEDSTYKELSKRSPRVGEIVSTIEGTTGEVRNVNLIKQTVKVIISNEEDDSKDLVEYPVSHIKTGRSKNGDNYREFDYDRNAVPIGSIMDAGLDAPEFDTSEMSELLKGKPINMEVKDERHVKGASGRRKGKGRANAQGQEQHRAGRDNNRKNHKNGTRPKNKEGAKPVQKAKKDSGRPESKGRSNNRNRGKGQRKGGPPHA